MLNVVKGCSVLITRPLASALWQGIVLTFSSRNTHYAYFCADENFYPLSACSYRVRRHEFCQARFSEVIVLDQ